MKYWDQLMYNVYQHWDPLKVCIVGKSYSPEFYSFIKNDRVRTVMERIAAETEEDYQKLVVLLESFGVKVLRPTLSDDYTLYLHEGKVLPPPMTPRDYSIMLGEDFYFCPRFPLAKLKIDWAVLRGNDWPDACPDSIEEFESLPEFIKTEILQHCSYRVTPCNQTGEFSDWLTPVERMTWGSVLNEINQHNTVYTQVPEHLDDINSAMYTRVGKDVYVGTRQYDQDISNTIGKLQQHYPQYRWHGINTGGHADGTYCPVVPGLIVSLHDIPTYADTYPGWEIVYLLGQSWDKVNEFLELKEKNKGKWWVPGEELNDEFTSFVEDWLGHWVGYVEETVFDVNMLVIDEKNVVCNNYNKSVFDAFEQYGITAHIINFRHRYFWDGGLHCITSDVHREGTMNDYFPNRNE